MYFYFKYQIVSIKYILAQKAAEQLDAMNRVIVIKKEDFSKNGLEFMSKLARTKLNREVVFPASAWMKNFISIEKYSRDISREQHKLMLYDNASTQAANSENCQKVFKLMNYDIGA